MSVPRSLLDSLCSQIQNLSLRVGDLERTADRAENRSETGGSNSEFELISGGASVAAQPASPSATGPGEVLLSDTEGRRKLAEGIGRFLLRCVRGEHRGTSGRDRLKLQNGLYVILADFEGNLLSDPQVEFSFAPVKALCKRGGVQVEPFLWDLPQSGKQGSSADSWPHGAQLPKQCLSCRASLRRSLMLCWCWRTPAVESSTRLVASLSLLGLEKTR